MHTRISSGAAVEVHQGAVGQIEEGFQGEVMLPLTDEAYPHLIAGTYPGGHLRYAKIKDTT